MIYLRNLLRETIFLRICINFIIGILMYPVVSANQNQQTFLIEFGALIFLVGIYKTIIINRYNITFHPINGIVVNLTIVLSAILICYVNDNRNNLKYYNSIRKSAHKIVIESEARFTKKGVKHLGSIIEGSEKYKIQISINDTSKELRYGDTIITKANINSIDSSFQLGQFDNKSYLGNKRIYHQLILQKQDILGTKAFNSNNLYSKSIAYKNALINVLKKNIDDEQVFNMAAALLLGERTSIDDEIMRSYRDTGTIHIISVSGLHVGIIFIILKKFFSLMPFIKRNKALNTILIVLAIWYYALLTGLPASVVRSAIMISFMIIGKFINKQTNPINHVAASALFMLSYEPNYLYDVGFQLSYLAVIGILYLQKSIENLFLFKNKILNYIWVMCSVSIAAQLFTLPLCLFYFHQFPNYFLLANIIAIPISSIALYASVAVLLFSAIPIVNTITATILTYSITLLNSFLKIISQIPGSVSKFEHIEIIHAILLSFIILFLILYIKERLHRCLKFSILCLILNSGIILFSQQKHRHIHIFEYRNLHSSIFTIENRDTLKHYFPLNTNEKEIEYYINNWKNYSTKVNKIQVMDLSKTDINKVKSLYHSKKVINSKLIEYCM